MVGVPTNSSRRDKPVQYSRRDFLARSSYLGAFYAATQLLPVPVLAAGRTVDSRVLQTPIADKGFASVRKVGEGLYATIADPSKGFQSLCNGGFLVGKDGVLMLEGFNSATGASFQMETMRIVTKAPVKFALNTHYHADHSMGNAFYGANDIALWAHANVGKRMLEAYGSLQGADKAAILAPYEKAVKEAKTDLAREHRQGSLAIATNMYNLSNSSVLALPNHPIDPTTLPMKVELGGLTAVLENFPGHSGTDILVRVPEQNVVYTGDLLFNGYYPVCFDSQATVSGWRQTLKTFSTWDKDILLVPGHGPVCGQETVALFRALFDDIEEQAQKLHKAGVPAAEAADQYVIPEKYKNVGVYTWDFSVGPVIRKLYVEWGAK